MEEKKVQQILTPEQRKAFFQALDDPEKKRQVIAILTAAEQQRELPRPLLQTS